jgi:hypothetical protein
MTLKTAEEINDLRKRVLAGEEFQIEEYRDIIRSYRAARLSGVTAAAPKVKAKAESASATAKVTVPLGDLLASMGLGAKKE